MTLTERIDRLDLSLFDQIQSGGTLPADRRSLLALHAALAARGNFGYLEVGSYLGASLQSFIVDPRCTKVVSIDPRDERSLDDRSDEREYSGNTTSNMLERLSAVPGAKCEKLTTLDASVEDLDPGALRADLCFIDAEHTNAAALRDARFCRNVIRDRGVIVFHNRTLIDQAIRRFLRELSRYRAYPLAHDLLVVEINVPSLLSDRRVRAQVPHRAWLVADRLRAMRLLLRLSPGVRLLRRVFGRTALALGAPHRSRRRPPRSAAVPDAPFAIHTFVNDDALYERMRQSFIDAGFSPDAFVRLTDDDEDPYKAITRIGRESTARYPILCHQDVLADQGVGAAELVALLKQLDAVDPYWVVAGSVGVMRSGRIVSRVLTARGGFTNEPLPLPVVTLDEVFLVFNARIATRCSADVSGFHLYGSDVCLHALASGGSAYVIDFPVSHLSLGNTGAAYHRARDRFIAAWSARCWFGYVPTTVGTIFVSRSRLLQRVFGSSPALTSVGQCRQHCYGLTLRPIDRIFALQLLRWGRRPRLMV